MIITSVQPFLNGGSKAMAVNGSVTPQVFSYSPGSGSRKIIGLSVIVADNAASTWVNFGSLGGLANGILVEAVISSIANNIFNLQDNADLTTCFPKNHFGSALISALGAVLGIGGSQFTFVGSLVFKQGILLTDSDQIQVTIRDNLSGLVNLTMSAIVETEI